MRKKETHLYSQYAQVFDGRSPLYVKDGHFNICVLRYRESQANDLLKRRGYIYLNEVYDMLGLPRTKAGQVVGWIYNEKNPTGDNYVEFELYPFKDSSIIIDFNVDGEILSLI